MNKSTIGYLHKDNFPFSRAESVQSYQIASRLSKKYILHGSKYSNFSFVNKTYKNKLSLASFLKNISVLFTIIDGYVDFYHEKITPLAKLYSIPNVWLINSPIEEMYSFKNSSFSHFKQKQFRQFSAKFVDHAICISEEMEAYTKKFLKIKNTSVIPNGADHIRFKPKGKSTSIFNDDMFNIMWSGNGEFLWQSLDLIQQAALYFEQRDPSIQFIVISDKIWTDKMMLSNVHYLHSVPNSLLPNYLNQADVCLCLYNTQKNIHFYRSPMKLFDYMAMQKPVIGTSDGQIKRVIKDKENGILIDNSVEQLIKAVNYLKQYPKLANSIQKKARQTILKHYTWDIAVNNIERVIDSFL